MSQGDLPCDHPASGRLFQHLPNGKTLQLAAFLEKQLNLNPVSSAAFPTSLLPLDPSFYFQIIKAQMWNWSFTSVSFHWVDPRAHLLSLSYPSFVSVSTAPLSLPPLHGLWSPGSFRGQDAVEHRGGFLWWQLGCLRQHSKGQGGNSEGPAAMVFSSSLSFLTVSCVLDLSYTLSPTLSLLILWSLSMIYWKIFLCYLFLENLIHTYVC